MKIGVIGLVEREWLDTINSLPPGLVYTSASAVAKKQVPMLREKGADMVIAVSHMREPMMFVSPICMGVDDVCSL
jgi:2',3'-cyclic-nucleotide 2'-phosphodiesterase (5'-nucleotidase family)